MTKATRRTQRDYTITPTGHGAKTWVGGVTLSQLYDEVHRRFPDAVNIVFEQDLLESTITVKNMDSDETLATIEVDE